MAEKIKLIGKLKDGQKIIGVLDEYDSDKCILITKDGNKIQLSMFNVLEQALDAGDYENEIIEIERVGNEYEISSYGTDDWDEIKPDEKPKG